MVIIGFLHCFTVNIGLKSMSNMYIFLIHVFTYLTIWSLGMAGSWSLISPGVASRGALVGDPSDPCAQSTWTPPDISPGVSARRWQAHFGSAYAAHSGFKFAAPSPLLLILFVNSPPHPPLAGAREQHFALRRRSSSSRSTVTVAAADSPLSERRRQAGRRSTRSSVVNGGRRPE